MKKALLMETTDQDESYINRIFLDKGHEIHGIVRRPSTFNTSQIEHIYVDRHNKELNRFLHYGDLLDSKQISNILNNVKPDEIYYLNTHKLVCVSIDVSKYNGNTADIRNTLVLKTIHRSGCKIKFYQVSNNKMFSTSEHPQDQVYKAHYDLTVVYLLSINLYRPHDNFNHRIPHVIRMLIRKFVEAIRNGSDRVEIWGTRATSGKLISSEKNAHTILLATEKYTKTDPVNIVSKIEITIQKLVGLIGSITRDSGRMIRTFLEGLYAKKTVA